MDVTDHLVQTGEKMIVAADPNICYVDDPPSEMRVQITNSQYPWPEVWKDADTSERASPNWVHTFDAEGHWVLKGSFTCWPGDTEDESTIDKTGQTIVGEEKTTTIHVMKPLTIRRVGVWHENQLPDTAEEWNSIEEEEEGDGEGSLEGATYALYELPKASTYTEWIRYYIVGGAKADPKGGWADKSDPDPKRLWWSQRLHLGSNKIEYLAEYNGLLLSHARDDDGEEEGVNGLIDLDVDTLNHWGDDYYTHEFRTAKTAKGVLADEIEDEKGKPGKIIFVNDIDKDGDNLPDYIDGCLCHHRIVGWMQWEKHGLSHRRTNTYEKFVPLKLDLRLLLEKEGTEAEDVLLWFDYPEAGDPKGVQEPLLATAANGEHREQIWERGVIFVRDRFRYGSPGTIRIWTKPGNSKRSIHPGGDVVESNIGHKGRSYCELRRTYRLKELGWTKRSREVTLWIEGIWPSASVGDIRVSVYCTDESNVKNGGGTRHVYEGHVASDSVRLTCVRSNLGIGVVRPYVPRDNDVREPFMLDYSSPYELLVSVREGASESQKAAGLKQDAGEAFWHEGGAFHGHGFAWITYDGPTELTDDDAANARIKQMRDGCRPHKGYRQSMPGALRGAPTAYFGKTGISGFIDYGKGRRDKRTDLVWWRFCPHKLSDRKPLVIQKTYTLHPGYLARIFKQLDDDRNYKNFGLHVRKDKKVWGWSCLSNVGLALAAVNFPGFERYGDGRGTAKWHKELDLPVTMQHGVMRIVDIFLQRLEEKPSVQTKNALLDMWNPVARHQRVEEDGEMRNIKWDETSPAAEGELEALITEMWEEFKDECPITLDTPQKEKGWRIEDFDDFHKFISDHDSRQLWYFHPESVAETWKGAKGYDEVLPIEEGTK